MSSNFDMTFSKNRFKVGI